MDAMYYTVRNSLPQREVMAGLVIIGYAPLIVYRRGCSDCGDTLSFCVVATLILLLPRLPSLEGTPAGSGVASRLSLMGSEGTVGACRDIFS